MAAVSTRVAQVPPRERIARLVGPAYRTLNSLPPVRNRRAPWLKGRREIDAFSPDGKGLGPDVALAEAHRRSPFTGGTAVLFGAGAGTEVDLLARHGVGHVVGIDLEAHPSKWPGKRAELARQGIDATFSLMDGTALALVDGSVDVFFSQSVLEHVVDLETMLGEARRVLAPSGRFVAWFGPIWTTFGGPHMAELAYDHLLVDEDELLARARQIGSGWEYWLELGLFNKLRYDDYLDLMREHFELEWVGVAGSSEGAAYRDAHPDTWEQLLQDHAELDLLTRLVGVVARPR